MEGQEPEARLEEESGGSWSGPGNHTHGRGLPAAVLPAGGGTGLGFRPRRLVATLRAGARARSEVQAACGTGDSVGGGHQALPMPRAKPLAHAL